MILLILALTSILAVSCLEDNLVAILSINIDDKNSRLSASLIKWLEASSTLVVPINSFTTDEEYEKIMNTASAVIIYADPEDVANTESEAYKLFKTNIEKVYERLTNFWSADEKVPLIVLGDADRIVLSVLKNSIIDINEVNFMDTVVTPLFNNIDGNSFSLLKGFSKNDLLTAQSSKPIYLNSNSLIEVSQFEMVQSLKKSYKVTSFTIRDGKKYVLSFRHITSPIEFFKFRPDIVTYSFALDGFKTPKRTQELRFNQKLSENLSLEMKSIAKSIDPSLFSFFGIASEKASNKQFYYTITNEFVPPEEN